MEARPLSKSDAQPFELSLRIRHPSIDPAELSREFQIEAEHAFRAGDPRPSRSTLAPPSVHTESYWLGLLKPARPEDLPLPESRLLQIVQEHLASATKTLSWALSLRAVRFFNTHVQLLRRIRSEGGQISLLVAICTDEVNSFSLAPEASRVFGELGITVEFDLTDD
jgi:hypothetical protein